MIEKKHWNSVIDNKLFIDQQCNIKHTQMVCSQVLSSNNLEGS